MAGDAPECSKYVGRWRYRLVHVCRVWPVGMKTHVLAMTRREVPICGFLPNRWGKLEAVYRPWQDMSDENDDRKRRYHSFELADEDVDTIVAAGASPHVCIDMKRIAVKMPGTTDERVKKQCWMEATFTVNPAASWRCKGDPWRAKGTRSTVCNLTGPSVEECLAKRGVEFSKVVIVADEAEIDEETLCREVVENDAVIVFKGAAVSGKRGRDLVERAHYWIVPGRDPNEDGGMFRGYQICDRFFRWFKRLRPEEREAKNAEHLEMMHEATREKGWSTRRTYFTDRVINRFAERIGMSRQRVTAKFLEDGIIDWLIRSVEGIPSILGRDAPSLLNGRITNAVDAIEFYYRAIEGGASEPANGGGLK